MRDEFGTEYRRFAWSHDLRVYIEKQWVRSVAGVVIGAFALAAVLTKSEVLKVIAAVLGFSLPALHLLFIGGIKLFGRRMSAALDREKAGGVRPR